MGLSPREAEALWYDWHLWARPTQLPPPGDWRIWLILAGRGAGKTRTGAEWVRERSRHHRRLALAGTTAPEVRDVMVLGESGLLRVFPPGERPDYQPSRRRLVCRNGAEIHLFSAEEPDLIRGHQFEAVWADELAVWRYPEAWDQLLFCLRLGGDPRAVVTTTPKPTPLIKDLVRRADPEHGDGTVVLTRGTTYDNLPNLAPAFASEIVSRYEGTALGRQELLAEILDDVEGALWQRQLIEESRVAAGAVPELTRVVVGVDPSGGVTETGIVVVGRGVDGHAYVLGDVTTGGNPAVWGEAVAAAYRDWRADLVVAERNHGGAMVRATIQTADPLVPVKEATATRSKRTRAEPVAALYAQGRVHHVGVFARLEDELCTWVPDETQSPNRLDALVWAINELRIAQADWLAVYAVVTCAGCQRPYRDAPTGRSCPYCGAGGGAPVVEVAAEAPEAGERWLAVYGLRRCRCGRVVAEDARCEGCGRLPASRS